jgi:hypothetical protein
MKRSTSMLDMTVLERGRLGYRLQMLPTEVASMPRLLASAVRVANPAAETSGK